MSNTASLYWLTRLDGIESVLMTISLVSGILLLIAFVFTIVSDVMNDDDGMVGVKKWAKRLGLTFFISLMINAFTPSRDEAIFIMAGGKTLDFAAQDSSLQAIPAQTTLMISKFLEQQIEEIESTEKEAKTE
jgi:hypothetical protein